MIALIVGALIAILAVVIVALPFLRAPRVDEDGPATVASEELLAMMENRDRALAALKELEFDHRTGKVDDVDYRALVGPLRRAAAEALQALDRLKAPSREERVPEQEQVQRDDQGGDRNRDGRGDGAVDERAHQVAPRGEADEGDQGEGDSEGENDL